MMLQGEKEEVYGHPCNCAEHHCLYPTCSDHFQPDSFFTCAAKLNSLEENQKKAAAADKQYQKNDN